MNIIQVILYPVLWLLLFVWAPKTQLWNQAFLCTTNDVTTHEIVINQWLKAKTSTLHNFFGMLELNILPLSIYFVWKWNLPLIIELLICTLCFQTIFPWRSCTAVSKIIRYVSSLHWNMHMVPGQNFLSSFFFLVKYHKNNEWSQCITTTFSMMFV